MSYHFYKVLHLLSVLAIFLAWGGLIVYRFVGTKGEAISKGFLRKLMITHGIGLVLALVAGFGLIVRLGLGSPWPLWVWLKLGIWLLLGAGASVLKRHPEKASVAWAAMLAIATCAAYLAIYKPG